MAGKGFREAKDGELLSDAFRDFVRQGKGTSGEFGAAFKAYAEALLAVAKAYGEKELTPEEKEEAREALYKINARGGAEAIEGVAMARDTTYKGNPNAPADATLRIAEYWDRKQGTAPPKDGGYAQFVDPKGDDTSGVTVTVHPRTVYPVAIGEPEALKVAQKARDAVLEAEASVIRAKDVVAAREALAIAEEKAKETREAARQVTEPSQRERAMEGA